MPLLLFKNLVVIKHFVYLIIVFGAAKKKTLAYAFSRRIFDHPVWVGVIYCRDATLNRPEALPMSLISSFVYKWRVSIMFLAKDR